MDNVTRYSDQELEEFLHHITKKLNKAKDELEFLLEQVQDANERSKDDGDWIDESSQLSDLERLHMMVNRNKKHILDLENALIRVENKNYGICVITGNLIDKRRLMAVPTTTKSLEAKTAINNTPAKPMPLKSKPSNLRQEPKIISKIVKRNGTAIKPADSQSDEEDIFIDTEDKEMFKKFGIELEEE